MPPGKVLFAQLTGVKEWDWSGRYWPKWGDALAEAGFTPNELNSSFSDDYLLEKYASFVRELGHIPTNAELKLKRRADSDFPSPNTYARFGKKKYLLGALLGFCTNHKLYGSLVSLIESEPHALLSEEPERKETKSDSTGYVYLIQFGKEFKIGNANNVERRFRELRTQMPYDGKIIHTIETGDPEGIETYWHQYFADKRLRGEWFALSSEDVKYFRKRKLM